MRQVTDIFPMKASTDQDERQKLYLLPEAIKLTRGSVADAELLLKDQQTQAFLGKRAACRLENSADGEMAAILLDFGRELHGNLRLTVTDVKSASRRVRVRIRFGESVMEALTPLYEKNAGNDHAVRDHLYDIGMLSTTETNESGFRFALIQLEEPEASLSIQAVHMCFIYRDIPYLGSFECSDPLLEKIWNTATYTVHLNMQNYLWDGIKRDRLVWQGDMHTEILTIENAFGANPVVPKTLDYLRDGTPAGEWMNGYSSYTLWWIIVQAEWYRYTGNLAYLEAQRAFLMASLKMAANCVDENGVEQLPQFRFLDWPNLKNRAATHAGLQGIVYLALTEGAYLLDVLNDKENAAKCRAVAERMRRHIPDCSGSKQAAALLALSGLGDAETLNREVLVPGGAHSYSTFMGYYILAAKALAGDWQGALDDLRAYWGGMLEMGATTFWEDFDLDWMENGGRIDEIVPEGKKDVHGDYGAYCYEKFRHSLCHGWSSGPVPFLTRHILGIQVTEPGCRRLTVAPHLGDLSYVRGTFPTPLGVVTVSHTKDPDGSVHTEYTTPEGVEITIE